MMAPEKPGHLLLQAFKAMNEPNGLTATQIIKFYSKTHDVPLSRATLAVQRALRMGLATGFVDKKRNRFVLGTEDGDLIALIPTTLEAAAAVSSNPYLSAAKKRRKRRDLRHKTKDQMTRHRRMLYRRRTWVRHRSGYRPKRSNRKRRGQSLYSRTCPGQSSYRPRSRNRSPH